LDVRRLAVVVVGGKGEGKGGRGGKMETETKRGEIRADRDRAEQSHIQFQTPCVAKMVNPARLGKTLPCVSSLIMVGFHTRIHPPHL
jgi:hypothetical protein